ncbi:MAG: septation regulator SpoVG [Candidatus Cloacimonas sp.]|nr:septation regulator SpoVG [Candidatus Cloacimonadota bacterium]
MNITDVKVVKREANQLRGFATIIIDDAFVVKNIKIIQGRTGLFIAMPSYKLKNGEHKDIAHPINSETRTALEQLILAKYEEVSKEEGNETEESTDQDPVD